MDLEKSSPALVNVANTYELPQWYNIGPISLPPWSHPRLQAALLGMCLFSTVGMYNVLLSIGGSGQATATLSDESNIALYAVFLVLCIAAPGCLSYFGVRASLVFGSIGYAAYAASLWCYNHTQNTGFVIFGGAWCGVSAAFLWVAEGVAIMSYASEDKKAMYIAIFWSIYEMGAVIGSCIPFAQNWKNTTSTVSDGTYIGLLVLMLLGAAWGLTIYPIPKMIREDGSKVQLERQKTLMQELRIIWTVTKEQPQVILFWPYCWATNYYMVYQSNDFNGLMFTTRARSLNAFAFALAEIPASWVLHVICDKLRYRRKVRVYIGISYILIVFSAVWIGGYFAMIKTVRGLPESERMDVFDPGFGWYCFLYAMYGFMDSCLQCFAYYYMGAMSNDPGPLSVYAAYYRLFSAACMVCAFSLDLQNYSIKFMFGTAWAYIVFGTLCLYPLTYYYVVDSNMDSFPSDSPSVIEGLDDSSGAAVTEKSSPKVQASEVAQEVSN